MLLEGVARIHLRPLCVLLLAALAPLCSGGILEPGRGGPDDLAVSGLFEAASGDRAAHLTRSALLAVPGVVKLHERLKPDFPVVDLTVLPLLDLLKVLPLARGVR